MKNVFSREFWGCVGPVLAALIAGFFLLVSTRIIPINFDFLNKYNSQSKAHWIILYNGIYSSSGISDPCDNQLLKMSTNGEIIEKVDFFPSNGCIIFTHKRYYAINVPTEILTEMDKLNKANNEIKQVLFLQNSEWLILSDKNKVTFRNIPNSLLEQLQSLVNKDIEINQISIAPNQGWVILYGNNTYQCFSIPNEFENDLIKLQSSTDQKIRQSVFAPDIGWVILYESKDKYAGHYMNGMSNDFIDKINLLKSAGANITQVSFEP